MAFSRVGSLSLLCAALAGPALPAARAELRAAAVKVDVTPDTPQWLLGYGPRQSKGVHDNLYHRVLVMHDGSVPFVLASTDLGAISPAFYDEVAAALEKRTGVPRKQFWWTVTHTHSAPEVGPPGLAKVFLGKRYDHDWDHAYTERVTSALVEAVRTALGKLEPARVAVGSGLSMANMNRRAREPDGTVTLGLNPDGPVDRRIGLVRIERPNGSVIALAANYAMHGTVLGEVRDVSADAPGIVAGYVEEKLGAPMLYIQGAAGDVFPIYFMNPAFRNLPRFNVLLGDRILEANRSMRADEAEEIRLSAEEKVIETARKTDLAWPAELSAYHRETAGGAGVVRVPVRFLRLRRDTVIWAAPVELFSEIAMRVRTESPFANTLYFGYANGWLGYLPTGAAMKEGGYEPGVSPFTGAAEKQFGDAVIEHLHGARR